jgi:serine/threonine-protein kinase PknG
MGSGAATIYGTGGYQAPEVELDRAEPSIASDLYTAGRLLAVLCLDFDGVQSEHRHTLPPKHEAPVLERYDSLHQLLAKATAPNPDDRFQSADEMAAQLRGVLREVVARETGEPAPARSTLFTAVFAASHDGPGSQPLPTLLVATDDAAAGWLATLAAAHPDEVVDALRRAPQETIEVQLRLAQALIDAHDWDELHELLDEIEQRDPWEWRAQWYRGVAALAQGLPFAARASFEVVYGAIPGELAPKLALGVCAELAGEHEAAAGWYEIVARTDPVYSTATFGLARCRLACGDVAGALAAYERVPETSSAHGKAQVARVGCLLAGEPEIASLETAADAIAALDVDPRQRAQLTAELLHAALALLQREPRATDRRHSLLGCPLDEVALRLRLEATYRALAAGAGSASERIRLVDRANAVRPRTWR